MLRHRWLWFVLLPITPLLCSLLRQPPNIEYLESDGVISCVEAIASTYFTRIKNVLIISSGDYPIGGEVIRKIGEKFCVNLAEPQSSTDFGAVHEYLVLGGPDAFESVRNMSLNPRGRFVFVTLGKRDTLGIAATKCSNAGIPNAIFVRGSADGSVTVFGYELGRRQPDVKIRLLDRWKSGKFLKGSDLFPSKFVDMGARELRVPVVNTEEMKPDIFVTRSEEGEAMIAGVGSNLVKLFAAKLNYRVVVFEHFSYGQKVNGSWIGPPAEIFRGDADLTFAGLIPVGVVTEDFDYSEFYRWDGFHFVTNTAKRKVSWVSLFKPFSSTVWTLVVIVYVLIFSLVHVLREFHGFDIVEEFVEPIDVLRVIFNQSARYPKTSRVRLAFFVLLLFAYWITTCYNSSLVRRLSQPSFGRNPNTLKDLAESKLEIGGIYALKYLLGDTGDPVDRNIYNRFMNLTARQFWTVLGGRERAVTVYRTAAIRHNWRYRLNESMQAHIIEDPIMGFPFMFYTRKGHPILDPLNNFIRNVHSSGLIVKWMSDYNAVRVEKRQGNEAVILTLDHFASVFIILVCGHVVSTLKFFQELYF